MPFDCQQIKEFRRCLGLTQTQLAKELQVPQCRSRRSPRPQRPGYKSNSRTNMRYMPTSRVLARSSPKRRRHRRARVSPRRGAVSRLDPPVWKGPHYHLGHLPAAASSPSIPKSTRSTWRCGSAAHPIRSSVSAATRRLFPGKRGPKVDAAIHARYDAEDLISGVWCVLTTAPFTSLEGNWCSREYRLPQL